MRKPYRSDLTDAQGELIRPLLPPAKPGGRPRTVDLREVVNTLFYQARTGCPWDHVPDDLAGPGHRLGLLRRLAQGRHLAHASDPIRITDNRRSNIRKRSRKWPDFMGFFSK